MKARWIRLLSTMLVIFLSCPLPPPAQAARPRKAKTSKSPPPAETAEKAWPPAELTLGFQTRDSETEGLGDLLVPLWNPGGTGLLFVNPRTAFTDDDAEEGNLGIGYRQLMPCRRVILGVNAFYDYRDTGATHYDQWGFGLEMLSPWVDARANYYDPDDKRQVVASETQSSVSQSVQTSSGWNSPYAEDHYVLQDYVTTRTLTTVTTTKTFEQYEQALGGYDWEIGLRLPLRLDALEARVFGGYYDFDRDFGDDARGWKARAEVRVLASLFLDAGLYENEDLTGSDWFAGARWSAPLDLGRLAQGRNPFAVAKSRLRGEPRSVSARLTEMVMRDPQIRLEQSKFLENPALTTEQTTRKVDKDRDPQILLSDVQFVDGDASFSGNGTADAPFDTIQQGVDAVFGTRNVYVFNASAPYEENVVLLPNTTLWGSGVLIPGYGGQFFGSGILPVVDGMDRGPTVTMVDHTSIQGFLIQNTYIGLDPVLYEGPIVNDPLIRDVSRVGILGDDAAHLVIQNNIISDNGTGVYVERQGNLELLFANNLVANNSDPHDYGGDGLSRSANGLEIYAEGSSGTFDVSIVDSVFGGNAASGALIDAGNYDASIVDIQNSAFIQNAISGLSVFQWDTGDAQTLLQTVQANDNGTGIFVGANGAGSSLFSLQEVVAVGNAGLGISIAQEDMGSAEALMADSQVAANGSVGLRVVQSEVDTAQAEVTGSVAEENGNYGFFVAQNLAGTAQASLVDVQANENAAGGILVVQTDADLAQADVGGATANGNGSAGIELLQIDTGLAVVRVADSSAEGNSEAGLLVVQSETELAVAAIGGMHASDNIDGISVQQINAGVALANVSGSCADGNANYGIQLSQTSDGASIGVIGMPDGLATTIDGLAGLLALDLPEEISPFFGPSGAVTANDNGLSGINSSVMSEGLVALAGLFDVTANDNGDNGAMALTIAPNGMAIGLAGSSENWEDIFDLARNVGDLLDLDLPLSLAGTGQLQANGNAEAGFMMTTFGSMAGINVAVGLETLDNGTVGTLINTFSESIGVSALARVESTGNGDAGLVDVTIGDDMAIGLLADINASDNGAEGIDATVQSADGIAALLALSTDALRPAAALLGDAFLSAPFEIPGSTFGPIVASGNAGHGILATVSGNELALAAFLDVQADDNGIDGFNVNVDSADGSAIAAFVSTDLVYDMLPGLLGIDPIPYDPLGGIRASGNGDSGIQVNLTGQYGSTLLMAGLEANNNVAGDGINATLVAPDGAANAFLVNVDASGNALGRGIDLNLSGFDEVRAGLINVEADWNGQQGIRVTGNSADSDAYALLAGIDTDWNGALGNQAGIVIDLTAGGDAAAALTDTYSTHNGGQGANLTLNAGADASLFVGDFAADDLDLLYGYSGDLGPLFDEIPTGPDNFSNNGGAGLRAELTSTAGDVNLGISGAGANYNDNAGYNLTLNALAGNITAGIEWAVGNNNGGNGLSLELAGAGGTASAWLERVNTWGNGANGINLLDNYAGATALGGQQIVSANNVANGVRIVSDGGGALGMDFGGGGTSIGQSSFYGNLNRDFRYNNGTLATAAAQFNWWGIGGGTFFGAVDHSNPLAVDPNAP